MAPLTIAAIAAVFACFFWWWRVRTTVTGGLAIVALATLAVLVFLLLSAPHPAGS